MDTDPVGRSQTHVQVSEMHIRTDASKILGLIRITSQGQIDLDLWFPMDLVSLRLSRRQKTQNLKIPYSFSIY